MSWQPPKSPHNLVQEPYFGDAWKILVCCLLLNLTTNKQVRAVLPELFQKYPDAASMSRANPVDLEEIIKSLGMSKKRTATLIRFSSEYLAGKWKTAKDLHGCGKYADDAYRIFVVGDWRQVEPRDHALNLYHDWLKEEYANA